MIAQEVKRKFAAILSATADFQRHSRKCFDDFLSRQKSRLSSRDRNSMLSAGGVMLLVFQYLIGQYMLEKELLALSMSTVIGTVIGYFLVRDNAIAVIVSAGCTTIVLTIAQFLMGATMEEFIMWWPLAIFAFFIYSFVATLVAFPLLDGLIARNKPGALKPESESISIEQDSKKRLKTEQEIKEQLEALRLEFNALAGKFYSTKSKEERAKIDAERDRIEKEMDRLRSQLNEY